MKRKSNIRAFILRGVAATLLSCLVLLALSFSGKVASSSSQTKTLTFAERVAYQTRDRRSLLAASDLAKGEFQS